MDKVPPPRLWFQRRRTDPGHVRDDPADEGTAFGLDMSLCQTSPAPRDGPRPAAPAGWTQRLLGRGRARR